MAEEELNPDEKIKTEPEDFATKYESQMSQKPKTRQENPEQKYVEEVVPRPQCNARIEELAKPRKHQVRNTYQDYKTRLPKRNVQALITFLEEEYAKSPEDTETNFKKKIRKGKVIHCRKLCKNEARKKQLRKINEKKRSNMLHILRDILKKYMTKAYFNPKQIIMTNRLRKISNTVLKELCSIRGINVPLREAKSIRASLMLAVSDFFAQCIDTIYYELQVQKVTDYEELKNQKQIEPAPKLKEEKKTPSVDAK